MVAAALASRFAAPCAQGRVQQRPARKQARRDGGNSLGHAAAFHLRACSWLPCPPPAKPYRQHMHMCIGSGCRPPGAPRPARRRSPGHRQFAVTQPARTSPSVAPCSLQLAVRAVAAEAASSTTGQPHGRVFNFSAGPAVLPLEVLEQAQADLLNWRGSGARQRGGEEGCS